jgi:hypothetical protein
MGSLDRQARHLLAQLQALEGRGLATRILPDRSWPAARSLVLADQVAVELGNPAAGSLSAALWTRAPLPSAGALYRIGPDVAQSRARSLRFGQLAIVSGAFDDEYELVLDLQDALCGVALDGVTLRTRPSSQGVWYRASREAVARGLSLAHLGGALLDGLEAVAGVEAAAVLLVVDDGAPWPEWLADLAREAGRVAAALVKRREERERECDVCDLADVCEEASSR